MMGCTMLFPLLVRSIVVMPGHVPGIHVFSWRVDCRVKPGHDEMRGGGVANKETSETPAIDLHFRMSGRDAIDVTEVLRTAQS